ncbi:hypothetical protein AHX81_001249 [Salmonella enterica subsp. enterica]|nr:hypothetical protein [Salmonella enterica subsp. enterica]
MANEPIWKGVREKKDSDDFSISRVPSAPPRQEKTSDSGSAERGTDNKPKE